MTRGIQALWGAFFVLVLSGQGVLAQGGTGEDPARIASFLRTVATHFQLPVDEVFILSEWNVAPDDVPVVLFLADRSGISPDVLVALRRAGNGWASITSRYGLGADLLHVPMSAAEAGPLLEALYGRFEATPRNRWGSLPLTDDEVLALVNLRVISQGLSLAPGAVMAARANSTSFVGAHAGLGSSPR